MSLLLEALNRSESERRERDVRNNLFPMHPTPVYGQRFVAHYGESHNDYPHYASQGATVINTGNQTPWFLVILCFNALLFVVAGLFWFQLENQKNNNDLLLFSHLINKNQSPSMQLTSRANFDNSLADLTIDEAQKQLNEIKRREQQPEIIPYQPVAQVNLDSLTNDDSDITDPSTKKTNPTIDDETTKGIVLKSEQLLNSNTPPLVPQPDQDSNIYTQDTLPAQLAASFPKLTYNAHLYSPDLPSARLIMVNGKKYNEKDVIQKGLIIDQITPQGVIYRFNHVKLQVNVVNELQ